MRVSDEEIQMVINDMADGWDMADQMALDLRDARALLREYAPDDWFAALHRDPDMCDPECDHCLVHGCGCENPCGDWDDEGDCAPVRVPHCADNCPYPKARELLGYAAT